MRKGMRNDSGVLPGFRPLALAVSRTLKMVALAVAPA